MKKNYFVMLLLLLSGIINAQITPTTYRGAFAPAPAAMWTDSWTNYDPQNTVYPAANVTVTGAITSNTTWTSGNTYLISGLVFVKNDATLTIQAGTRILGDNSGSALIITRGAKLNAIGTATSPIVFTSDKAVGARTRGDWGGVILLGKAQFNINGGVNNIEGITATPDTQYGGGLTPDNNDNSGTLKYVRIEFGGFVFAPNSEINGLTMGAVGAGTTIDYVQVSHTNDDAFEWFGGTVDCKHLVSFRNLDDDFDTDNGFTGRVQFCLAVRDPQVADAPAVSTSEGFECDNNANGTTVTPRTGSIFSNVTMVGPTFRNTGTLATGYRRVARLRRASEMKIYNSVFMDFAQGLHIDGVACENAAVAGNLRWNNNIMAGITSGQLQITAPGNITVGNNPAFNLTSWYAANGNTTLASNAGLLALPYNTSNLGSYTGLDYRPAASSPLLSGSDFSDSFFNGILDVSAPDVVPVVAYCRSQVATPLTATLTFGATQLRWYTVATGGTASTTAPTPSTSTVGTTFRYVSQVRNGIEGPRATIAVVIAALPSTPGSIAAKHNDLVISSSTLGNYVGTPLSVVYSVVPVVGAASYEWTVPADVTIVDGQGTNSLTVNFLNTAATAGTFVISVKSVSENGCLSSARTWTGTRAIPATPGTITTSLVNVCSIVGVPQTFVTYSLVAAPGLSYTWTVPTGAFIKSGQGTNVIEVGYSSGFLFSGAVTATASNGIGSSLLPRSLTVTRRVPSTPGVPVGQTWGICPTSGAYNYTITAAPSFANNWTITAPAGSVITSPSNPNNNTNVLANTNDLAYSIVYPTGYDGLGSIVTQSFNGCANSALRTTRIYKTFASPASITGPLAIDCDAIAGTPVAYTCPIDPLVDLYTWQVPAGATIASGQGTNAISVIFSSALATTSTLRVSKSGFVCGVATVSSARSITLTRTCFNRGIESSAVTYSELYPNPSTNNFNIDINAENDSEVTIVVYNFTGNVVSQQKHTLTKGENTINTDTSRLPRGLYVVKFINPSSDKVETKKYFKN